MPLPLEGIRVLDWTIWQQGPVATTMLGDLGAEVIKIEEREGGDPGRGLVRARGRDLRKRPNFYFEANNRNKKSITLDLKHPQAREVVYALVEHSDVFVQNFRHGVAARLGLDYETLKQHNPKLIYGSATGYGPHGPDAAEPSFDMMGLARSGAMFTPGEPDMPPMSNSAGIADQMGAIMLSHGILTALFARERHGVGQEVNASHLGSMMMLQGLGVSANLMLGFPLPRMYRHLAKNPLYNHYRCSDDKWIALGMPQSDRYWDHFVTALGRPELIDDERCVDQRTRGKNAEALVALFDEAFLERTRDEWMAHLRDAPGDLFFTQVNTIEDLPEDPQVQANDYIVEVDHPEHGKTRMMGMPIQFSETPGSVRNVAPEHGQNTEEILLDVLGWEWERITELREAGII